MAAIFPVLDLCSCIATKWTRHLGFCISYTALLMKTWRVSLTYRVKSAHKVKLTDKQLLQWMVPILLVMLIYLSTWTLSAPPGAHVIADSQGLQFNQCDYNWWDHSLAIGELLIYVYIVYNIWLMIVRWSCFFFFYSLFVIGNLWVFRRNIFSCLGHQGLL